MKFPIVFFAVFFSFSGFLACTELSEFDNRQIQSSLNDSLVTTTESWGVELVLMQEGRARIFLEGTRAVGYQSPGLKQTNIDGPVYVQLFDSLGSVETEAWSKRAVYLEESGTFELYDSVRVETSGDRQLYTEFLEWTQETDRISSPRFVTIITPSDSISGSGFDAPTDLSTYTIQEPGGWMIVN